jgi:hypothetical protein
VWFGKQRYFGPAFLPVFFEHQRHSNIVLVDELFEDSHELLSDLKSYQSRGSKKDYFQF